MDADYHVAVIIRLFIFKIQPFCFCLFVCLFVVICFRAAHEKTANSERRSRAARVELDFFLRAKS